MTFQEAKKELKRIANGEYHSLRYSLTEYSNGNQLPECSIYIHGATWVDGVTWRQALNAMRRELGLPVYLDIHEMP